MEQDLLAVQAERRIYLIRAQRVMLDFDLAELYQVETRTVKQAVRRNEERLENRDLSRAESADVMRETKTASRSSEEQRRRGERRGDWSEIAEGTAIKDTNGRRRR